MTTHKYSQSLVYFQRHWFYPPTTPPPKKKGDIMDHYIRRALGSNHLTACKSWKLQNHQLILKVTKEQAKETKLINHKGSRQAKSLDGQMNKRYHLCQVYRVFLLWCQSKSYQIRFINFYNAFIRKKRKGKKNIVHT